MKRKPNATSTKRRRKTTKNKKSKTKTGRPSKFTQEKVDIILEALMEGNFKCVAAAAAGIHVDTLNEWEHKYPDFSEAVKVAEAESERYHVRRIKDGAERWQSSAWWLERKHRDRWATEAKPEDKSAKDWQRLVIAGDGSRIVLEHGATLIGSTWSTTAEQVDPEEP